MTPFPISMAIPTTSPYSERVLAAAACLFWFCLTKPTVRVPRKLTLTLQRRERERGRERERERGVILTRVREGGVILTRVTFNYACVYVTVAVSAPGQSK